MIPNLIKILSLFAIPFLMVGLIISLIVALLHGNYNMLQHSISELGVSWCTPYPKIFNYTFMISGILFIFFFLTCGAIAYNSFPSKSVQVIIATILLMISGIGIFLVGYFNIEKNAVLHTISAIITFACLGIGELIMAILQAEHGNNHLNMIILIITFCGIAVLFAIYRNAIFEWLFFAVLLLWGFPLVIRIYQCLI